MFKPKNLDPVVCRIPKASEEADLAEALDSSESGTWRIFRIMAEFVSGFHFIGRLKRTVTFFGSARLKEESLYYQQALELSRRLGAIDFNVVTGGGPGIMEAGNRGDFEATGSSIGLNIQLPLAQRMNKYVTRGIGFHYFFTRKVMLSAASQAYVFFPGGFGTLDEFLEIITLIQTRKMEKLPVVLVSKEFWQPLLSWIDEVMVKKFGTIDEEDTRIYILTDSVDEAFNIIKKSKPRHAF